MGLLVIMASGQGKTSGARRWVSFGAVALAQWLPSPDAVGRSRTVRPLPPLPAFRWSLRDLRPVAWPALALAPGPCGLQTPATLPAEIVSPPLTLDVSRLSVRRGGLTVLEDVSFSLPSGSLSALVGPNGAGKSTLLHALVGLIPRQSGEVRLDGEPLDAASARHRLALMPQRSEIAWHFPIRVRELVALGQLASRRRGCCDVEAALQRVGLAPLADRRLDQLSGGQQQRALLARTLVEQSAVLLLDEPCAAIDPPTRTALLQVMGQLRDAGLTLLVCSHDWGRDLDAYDQVLVLDRQLLASGPPAEVRQALGDLRIAAHACG